jgi:hypothetical protein
MGICCKVVNSFDVGIAGNDVLSANSNQVLNPNAIKVVLDKI